MLEGINQYYSEELSQKTKRGQHETRSKGLFPGGTINYGYSVINRKVVINEEESIIVKRIFAEYANGKRLFDIAEDLKSDGIVNRKGAPFMPESIYYMLHMERYVGKYTVNGILYDKIFPQLISEPIFQVVQKRLNENKHGKHVIGVEYILKGKVFCECGNPIRSAGGSSRTRSIYRYYRCFAARRTFGCKSKSFRKDILEKLIIDVLTEQITNGKNLDFLTDKILEKLQRDSDEAINLKALEKSLLRTTKSLSNLIKAIENGIFSDTTKERLTELEKQKKELTEKILIERNKTKTIPSTSEIKDYLKYAIKQAPKNLIDLLIRKIVIYQDKIEIFIKYTNSPFDNPPNNDGAPDGTNNSDRDFLLTEYATSYKMLLGGKRKKLTKTTMLIRLLM